MEKGAFVKRKHLTKYLEHLCSIEHSSSVNAAMFAKSYYIFKINNSRHRELGLNFYSIMKSQSYI